jgi:hypothetical protein
MYRLQFAPVNFVAIQKLASSGDNNQTAKTAHHLPTNWEFPPPGRGALPRIRRNQEKGPATLQRGQIDTTQ